MVRIVFVCLGNICRSPLAEGVFQKLIEERDLQGKYFVDSAGTSAYHIGELADPRSRLSATQNGFELTHRAQQFQADFFETFDIIIAMDQSNLANILSLSNRANDSKKVVLMSAYDFESIYPTEVPDPYFGGEEGFQNVYNQLLLCCTNLLDDLEKNS